MKMRTLLTLLVCIIIPPASADLFCTNLLLNADAETGAGSVSGLDVVSVPNWTTANNFTVGVYQTSPGAAFGANYFTGGPDTPLSTASQTIDVSADAPQIDGGYVTAELSGYFGGLASQDDHASLTMNCLGATTNSLASFTIGNVLAADRNFSNLRLLRAATNAVPAGTRSIQLTLTMTRVAGTYNDGVADNLSLLLRSGATIFDNTSGSENGGFGGSATNWLASKFCLGSQPYRLESVSLLLNSQDFSGAAGPPSMVRLQIYTNDPVSGKPSASTGLIMNLCGHTNPITLLGGNQLVKWTPATPFNLPANTSYWAVWSAEDGKRIGQIASFTQPTGDAGCFGSASSTNAGATWGSPGNYNFKMLIRATPAPSPLPELAADFSTAIPGGTGNFTSLPNAPSLSGNNLAFYGAGAGGQQGLYLSILGAPAIPPNPVKIADMATAIPGGTGNFSSFGTEAGIIIVSGNNAVFAGSGSGGQRGIYAAVMVPPQVGPPIRIADTSTTIPGGSGTFTEFPKGPSISGNTAVFAGNGTGAQKGVYAAVMVPPQVGSPLRIADTSTSIPGGSGAFTAFPTAPSISGNTAVFAGSGTGPQKGVYAAVMVPPQVGSPLRIADTSTSIPGGSGTFTALPGEPMVPGEPTLPGEPIQPAISGNKVVFAGDGAGGQKGVYAAVMVPPQVGSPLRVADTATSIPGGTGNFTGFGAVSVSQTDVAFVGTGAGGQTGIYDLTGGQLRKVVSVGEAIKGKTITSLKFAWGGLFGDPVAFQATFSDGSEGVYRIAVIVPPFELRITEVEPNGNDLRLRFTSLAGTNYAIQSSTNLATGTWMTLTGTTTSGTGSIVQVTLTNALTQPEPFYRVRELP